MLLSPISSSPFFFIRELSNPCEWRRENARPKVCLSHLPPPDSRQSNTRSASPRKLFKQFGESFDGWWFGGSFDGWWVGSWKLRRFQPLRERGSNQTGGCTGVGVDREISGGAWRWLRVRFRFRAAAFGSIGGFGCAAACLRIAVACCRIASCCCHRCVVVVAVFVVLSSSPCCCRRQACCRVASRHVVVVVVLLLLLFLLFFLLWTNIPERLVARSALLLLALHTTKTQSTTLKQRLRLLHLELLCI